MAGDLTGRNHNGTFSKGNTTGTATQWVKGQSGNTGGMHFTQQCRGMLEKYGLIEEVAMIAKGVGPYKRAALKDRLDAFQQLCDRALGKPAAVDPEGTAYQELTLQV